MPYALITIGLVLFVAGVRGKNNDLWLLVKGDFTGSNSFIFWIAAVAVVGSVGYVKPLKPLSVAFLTLLLVVLVLSNKGVVAKLQSYLNSPGASASPTSSEEIAPLPPLQSIDQITSNLRGTLGR